MTNLRTLIAWTDVTWSPVTGCSKVSPGCAHCYAETVAARFWPTQYPPVLRAVDWNVHPPRDCFSPRKFTDVQCHPERLEEPLRWRKPRKVFVNSMSDLFHEDVPDAFIDRVFAVMANHERHTFQVLTKRADRMRAYLSALDVERLAALITNGQAASEPWAHKVLAGKQFTAADYALTLPLPNVWLGVSVENQHFAAERIPLLLQTPAAIRFVSYEPALGPVDFTRYVRRSRTHHFSADVEGMLRNRSFDGLSDNGKPLTLSEAEAGLRALLSKGVKRIKCSDDCVGFSDQTGCPGHPDPRLDWVIVGGESGPKARPFDVAWARSVVQQCKAAGVACFVKQLGARPVLDLSGCIEPVMLRDRKGGDPAEWPEDLRVREYPEGRS